MNKKQKPILVWSAPEYTHYPKSFVWLICAGAVGLGFVLYGLMTDGWTFSIAILAFAGTYYLVSRNAPETVAVEISKTGVSIGRHNFPFTKLKSFWIVYEEPHVKRLYVRFHSRVHPDIFISLEDMDPAEVRSTLKLHLDEMKDGEEPLSDVVTRLLKL